jgi:hypothetical protein
MKMILFDAVVTPSSFLVVAVLGDAEFGDLLTVFTPAHVIIIKLMSSNGRMLLL